MTNYQIQISGLILQGLIGLLASLFAALQFSINRRLIRLQDYVAVSIVPGNEPVQEVRDGKMVLTGIRGYMKLLNTGASNVYLHRIAMPGRKESFSVPRMIPAHALEASYYWLPPPASDAVQEGNEFLIKLFLTDEGGKKYLSIHGGVLNNSRFAFWSLKTHRSKWSCPASETGPVID